MTQRRHGGAQNNDCTTRARARSLSSTLHRPAGRHTDGRCPMTHHHRGAPLLLRLLVTVAYIRPVRIVLAERVELEAGKGSLVKSSISCLTTFHSISRYKYTCSANIFPTGGRIYVGGACAATGGLGDWCSFPFVDRFTQFPAIAPHARPK